MVMWAAFAFDELTAQRTRVNYSTGFDPGRMLSMLAKGPVVGRVRSQLVDDVLAGFKKAVENG